MEMSDLVNSDLIKKQRQQRERNRERERERCVSQNEEVEPPRGSRADVMMRFHHTKLGQVIPSFYICMVGGGGERDRY